MPWLEVTNLLVVRDEGVKVRLVRLRSSRQKYSGRVHCKVSDVTSTLDVWMMAPTEPNVVVWSAMLVLLEYKENVSGS